MCTIYSSNKEKYSLVCIFLDVHILLHHCHEVCSQIKCSCYRLFPLMDDLHSFFFFFFFWMSLDEELVRPVFHIRPTGYTRTH